MNLKAVAFLLPLLLVPAPVYGPRAPSAPRTSHGREAAVRPFPCASANDHPACLPAPRQHVLGRSAKRSGTPFAPGIMPSRVRDTVVLNPAVTPAIPRPVCSGSSLYVFMALLR